MAFNLKPTWRIPKKDVLIAIVIILIGTASFALGKFSSLIDGQVPLKIERDDSVWTASVANSEPKTEISTFKPAVSAKTGAIVAAKGGKRYYLPTCSAANRISDANKIWFANTNEARAAGYTPAENCPGIK